MLDDYHTGIRSPEDIKTFNEVINDEDSFVWGDFSKEDAQQALKQGKVTVYSSYPIEQGVFVSTSKIQAQEYAGGNGSKVYSKEVPLDDVAWINGDEGQYAKLPNSKTVKSVNLNNQKISENGEKSVKSNIIDEKVSEYIKSVKDNFNTDINIDTNVVNKDNIVPIDYENEKQTTIYKRARDIFQKIGKRVFINKNDGEKIYVTNTDINESISKTIKNPKQNKLLKENMAVFSKLDKIIENGKEISNSKIDSKGRENFSDYRYYVTNAIINGKKYVVEFDTRVQERNNGAEERHFRLERIYEIKEGDSATGADIKSTSQVGTESPSINNIIPSEQNYVNNTENNQKIAPVKKIMNPAEIANMKESDVSNTPKLPTRNYGSGNKKSSFYRNVTSNSKFLNQELRNELKNEKDIKFYQGVTNEQSLTNALNKLNDGGEGETLNWFNKKDKFTAELYTTVNFNFQSKLTIL